MTEGDTAAALNTSGALTITDPDTGEAHVVAQTSAHGTYGDFTIDATATGPIPATARTTSWSPASRCRTSSR